MCSPFKRLLVKQNMFFYLLSHYVTAPLQPRGALSPCVLVLICYMRLIAIFTPICFNLRVQNLTLLQLHIAVLIDVNGAEIPRRYALSG